MTGAKTVYYNLKLIDGVSDELQVDRILVVNQGRFEEVLRMNCLGMYPDYPKIDLNGMTVLPGLIDMHVHISNFQFTNPMKPNALFNIERQRYLNLKTALKYGITTVRDMGGFPVFIQKAKRLTNVDKSAGPEIICCNSFITTIDGPPERYPKKIPEFINTIFGGRMAVATRNPDEVRAAALDNLAAGADFLKTHYTVNSAFYRGKLSNLSDQSLRIIKDLATERNVKTAIHHQENTGFKKALQFNFDTVEHCSCERLDDADINTFVENRMAIIPTLKIHYSPLHIHDIREYLDSQDAGEDFTHEALRQMTQDIRAYSETPYPPSDYRKGSYQDIELSKRAWPITIDNLKKIKEAGGIVGVGTDAFSSVLNTAAFYWQELSLLTMAGFSIAEVLRMATSGNAEILGRDDIGAVEKGKKADFIAVDGNPLETLEVLRKPSRVFREGELVHSGL